jgi:hypothetical protein
VRQVIDRKRDESRRSSSSCDCALTESAILGESQHSSHDNAELLSEHEFAGALDRWQQLSMPTDWPQRSGDGVTHHINTCNQIKHATVPTPIRVDTSGRAEAVRFHDTKESPGDLCSMSFTSWE